MTTIDTQGRAVSLETSFLETGMFGDGSDGTVTFDGTSTVLGLVPSSSTYTLNRSIFCQRHHDQQRCQDRHRRVPYLLRGNPH